ncbi:MAG: M20/M25/M40 family metallo-hydrolase [Acidobacteria bacterium]|nr:M20/M25/M40 family metallo-hydrolase [Acidobacteriota bacterium]
MPPAFHRASKTRGTASTVPAGLAELAESSGVRECLQWFGAGRQWLGEKHLELCRIPAPTFLEQKRAEWMAGEFQQMGLEVSMDRAGNVIAVPPGERNGPLIALTGHLDTVLSPRRPEDVSSGPDGRLTGPGVADNGAGLAALLGVARAVQSAPPLNDGPARIAFVATVGEEGEGNLSGMRFLCRPGGWASRVQAFVVLDGPATDHITCHALASRRFEISFAGPGGHSWSDYGVGNPVHALSHAITLFVDCRGSGGPAGRTSFNFGVIEGGVSINSIPSHARAKLDLRSETPEPIDEMAAQLTDAVEQALATENQRSPTAKVTAKIREIGSRPGGRLAEDAALLRYLRAVDAHLGIRAQLDCASTDANIPLSLGLPAVSIGAGGQGGGAHTPAEWYSPEGRDLGLKRILLTLALLLRDPDGTAFDR